MLKKKYQTLLMKVLYTYCIHLRENFIESFKIGVMKVDNEKLVTIVSHQYQQFIPCLNH
jgi:hypothetical protein